jgi:hypothetical protein
MAVTDDQADFQYDEVGNVIGGLRTPYVDIGRAAPGSSAAACPAGSARS